MATNKGTNPNSSKNVIRYKQTANKEMKNQVNELLYFFDDRYEKHLSEDERHILAAEMERAFKLGYKLGREHGEIITTAENLEILKKEIKV